MVKFNLKNLILILFSLVMFAGGASARSHTKSHSKSLSMRQTKKVAQSPKMAVNPQVARLLYMADENTEKLDAYSQDLLKIYSLSMWQRWSERKKISDVKQGFSSEMQKHLAILAELFKIRSHQGRLLQYQEFEFQNLLRKSDYLLSLDFSRDSLEFARRNKDFSASFGKTLISYNEQRFNYDRKSIEMKL